MKRFLIKTLIFICFGGFAFLLSFVLLKQNLKDTIKSSDVIILGDSHTVSLNLNNAFNYSLSGAPYILHYNFAKTFEEQIKNKTVIISFGFHNLSKSYENRFNRTSIKEGWIPLINDELNGYNLLGTSYNYDWIRKKEASDIVSKKKLLNLNKLSNKELRINTASIGKDTLLFNKTLEKHYSQDYKASDEIQLKYITLLIAELKKNNCTIILINTPVTRYYYKHVPEKVKKKHSELLQTFDVTNFDLNVLLNHQIDASCFKDADHLNTKGDQIIEAYLNNKLADHKTSK
ncbi:hypothetical protein [Psychroserpens ponticola]|uniref:SGNH/GDSL hydrolase family protein n=1 Tax=Psychroserpens ponticola TaxID=2932268 RepID=A0ABY7S1Q9_9FLAO|nr:hypothetical protein [Psychroserpens ponticola]WCO02945.1 hypothetical protein MUN68_005500 [Psychroserpens ponticola]